MAVETYGCTHQGVLAYLRLCADLAAKRQFSAAPYSRETARLFHTYRQRWAIALQRGQAVALNTKSNRALPADDWPEGGQPDPFDLDYLLHTLEPEGELP
ncbi:hypothetical protein CLOP_g11124 [Closterium sp. NIES-67]|nr:hypothetical protein CLOP_g11124 [Closterium sp. NIES-67]